MSDIVVFSFHTMPVPMMMVAFCRGKQWADSSGVIVSTLYILLSQVDFDF